MVFSRTQKASARKRLIYVSARLGAGREPGNAQPFSNHRC